MGDPEVPFVFKLIDTHSVLETGPVSPHNRRLQAKAGKRRNASARRSSLTARYPVNGAWPAEMRIDMLAAYLDFRTVRELALAISRGHAPPPTGYRGAQVGIGIADTDYRARAALVSGPR
jgi:hypothetical protein